MIIHPPSIYHIIDDLSQIVINNLLARHVLVNTKEGTAKEKKKKDGSTEENGVPEATCS